MFHIPLSVETVFEKISLLRDDFPTYNSIDNNAVISFILERKRIKSFLILKIQGQSKFRVVAGTNSNTTPIGITHNIMLLNELFKNNNEHVHFVVCIFHVYYRVRMPRFELGCSCIRSKRVNRYPTSCFVVFCLRMP